MRIRTSVADIFSKPDSGSERISQLIWGEQVEVIEPGVEFSLVRCVDGVEGYVKSALIADSPVPTLKLTRHQPAKGMTFSFGSYLTESEVQAYSIPRRYVVPISKRFIPVDLANRFLGVPYLWGGTSDFGFDCSGFTQRLFRFSGIEIPRNSYEQRDASKDVGKLSDAVRGDLIFFKGHVAIYLGKGRIIHANGHFSRVSYTDLFDGNAYSNYLLSNIEKVGRFRADSA
jgi:hypothetical protein